MTAKVCLLILALSSAVYPRAFAPLKQRDKTIKKPIKAKLLESKTQSATTGFELGFRQFCCDKTTEWAADEIYFLIVARRDDGRLEVSRVPSNAPHREEGHWNMNDGNQGTKNANIRYNGDAHCLRDGRLLLSEIKNGQSWNILIYIMEEDGGATQDIQRIAGQALSQVKNPYAQKAGVVLSAMARLGLFIRDSDDFIGGLSITVQNRDGQLRAYWDIEKGERLAGSQEDPEDKDNQNKHEFRFNGDSSNYVIWYFIRPAQP